MRKWIPALLIVGLVIAVSVLVISKKSTSGPSDDFALPAKTELSKIILTKVGEDPVVLKKIDGQWYVNERYSVRNRQFKTLITTLKKMRSVHPVSDAAYNNIVKEIMTKGVKTELYNDNGKLIKTIHVGGATLNNKGSYMMLEEKGEFSDRPHVVNIPGFNGFLTSRFITSVEEWRSREVISYQPEEIKSVEVSYPGDTASSFRIENSKDEIKLFPESFKVASKDLLRAYLELYKTKSVETYINTFSRKDSILSTEPFCIIDIETQQGEKEEIVIYYKEISERSKSFTNRGKPLQYDLDKFYALVNHKEDFAIIQYYVFGPLFQKYEDFFVEGNPTI